MATNTAKNAIIRAKIDGVVTDFMVKTNTENVMVDETTTLAGKLTEILTAIAGKAAASDITTAVNALRQELMGEGVPEAYDTFKELADYIEQHQEAADALTAAIGDKADKSVVDAIKATVDTLGTLATKSTVAESDLDAALKAKVNAAAEGNHSHDNKAVLDGITADKVASWDGKGNGSIYFSATEPATLGEHDLWVQIVE